MKKKIIVVLICMLCMFTGLKNVSAASTTFMEGTQNCVKNNEKNVCTFGLKFYKGESIRVIISPKEEYGNGMMPGTSGCTPNNKGWQFIHTGGDKASYLQLPVLKK